MLSTTFYYGRNFIRRLFWIRIAVKKLLSTTFHYIIFIFDRLSFEKIVIWVPENQLSATFQKNLLSNTFLYQEVVIENFYQSRNCYRKLFRSNKLLSPTIHQNFSEINDVIDLFFQWQSCYRKLFWVWTLSWKTFLNRKVRAFRYRKVVIDTEIAIGHFCNNKIKIFIQSIFSM